jgi:tetratricopeptide (TPR) repeat protein
MADNYRLCPCGSGKKAKFCCKELAPEIEKILKLIAGEQRAAAIQALDLLIKKRGDLPTLLDLKVSTLVEMERFQDAEEVVLTLLQADPDSFRPYALAAILDVLKGSIDDAVTQLQRALERIGDDGNPAEVLDALSVVAIGLCKASEAYPARAHLALWVSLCDDESVNRPLQILLELDENMHPLLQTEVAPQAPDEDADWGDKHEQSQRLFERGAWLGAARILDELARDHPEAPWLRRQHAYTVGFASPHTEMAASLHDFARLENADFDDAVEAEALAQLLDSSSDGADDVLDVALEVADQESAMEKMLSQDRSYSIDPSQIPPTDQEGPPPKGVFTILSKKPENAAPPSLETTPLIHGQVLLYGRETDRPARVRVIATEGAEFESVLAVLQESLGDDLGEECSREVIGKQTGLQNIISPPLFLQPELSADQQYAVRSEAIQDAVANRWAELRNSHLGGKRPIDVVGDPELRIRLAGSLLLVEQTQLFNHQRVETNELRKKLGLPEIDVKDATNLDDVHGTKYSYVDVAKLDDQTLKQVLRAGVFRARRLIATEAIQEAIKRGLAETDDSITLESLYDLQLQWTEAPGRLFEIIEAAKENAKDDREQLGELLLKELVLRMRTRDQDGAKSLAGRLLTEYAGDERIQNGLMQILGGPQSMPHPPADQQQTAIPSASDVALSMAQEQGDDSGLWTPENEAQGGGEDKESSGLWLPD